MVKSEAVEPTHDDDVIVVTDFVLASGHADTVIKDAAWRLATGLPKDAGEKAEERRRLRQARGV